MSSTPHPEPAFITGVFDSLPLEILVVDQGGRVILWNRGLEARVAPRGEVLGRPIEEVFARFTQPRWGVDWAARIRAEVLAAGRSVEVRRYPQRTGGDALRLCDVRADPINDGAGRVVGAVVSLRDVTDSARLEVESVRAAKAAEVAQLGASVAHEIRNPLNSIGMNAQLLREAVQALPPEVRREDLRATADLIVQEIRRLNGVVTTFLSYARQPGATLRLDDPNAAVRQAARLLEAEAERAGVALTVDCGTVPAVPCDRDQLAQAVYNLLLNGIQELSGGGRLRVATSAQRDVVVIEVTDTGRGIPPDQRERVFELFHTTRTGGTGLGLPIVRRIVEAHGGRVVADDNPDGGARFRIYLPIEPAGRPVEG